MAEGDTVTFTADARGTSPLFYQWNKNGHPIDGQNALTLTLLSVSNLDSGLYTLSVSNSAGVIDSHAANLCVCLRPVPGIFGTGLDTDGALLAAGAVDPHYILASSADGDFPGPDAIVVNEGYPIQPGTWLLNGPSSKWIAPRADQSGVTNTSNLPGDYTYETSFDLTGYDLSQLTVVGGWAVDNTGTDILLNGSSLGLTSPGFGSFAPFTLTEANGLVAGPNTVDFIMNNAGTAANPTALRVNLRGLINLQPLVTLTPNGQNSSISWAPVDAKHLLQHAPTPIGPWTTIDGATSPYPIDARTGSQYFRVLVQ